MEDKEQLGTAGKLNDSQGRVLRGGSFGGVATIVRCAMRSYDQPVFPGADYGFRVSRTYP
jgi:formylglycine-generating enzyme required for sulfatase activity